MYAYLKGEITQRGPSSVVIEVGGVGYDVRVTTATLADLHDSGPQTIYTHLIVREDAHTLFGFSTEMERRMFLALVGVSGVGATTAVVVLSTMKVPEIVAAIKAEKPEAFKIVKGVGAKTASQIVLDLKSKIAELFQDILPCSPSAEQPVGNADTIDEATKALVALGFKTTGAKQAVLDANRESPGLETAGLFAAALKFLA